jgi:hypothetical protein
LEEFGNLHLSHRIGMGQGRGVPGRFTSTARHCAARWCPKAPIKLFWPMCGVS